jgi:hypothetical protein
MKKYKYPLEQIAEIKKRRLEEAEKILREKRELVDKEEKVLIEKKKALVETQKVKNEIIKKHYKEIEEGTTSDILERHDLYMKEVINVKIAEEKKNVDDQKKVVIEAKKELELARENRLQKNQDLEKIHLHKKEWLKGARKQMALDEAIVSDELGTGMHTRNKRKK